MSVRISELFAPSLERGKRRFYCLTFPLGSLFEEIVIINYVFVLSGRREIRYLSRYFTASSLSLLLPLFDVFSRPLIPPLPTFDQWSRSTVTPKGTSWRAANFPSTGRLTKKRGTFQSLCGDCSPGAPRNIRRKGIVELAAGDA